MQRCNILVNAYDNLVAQRMIGICTYDFKPSSYFMIVMFPVTECILSCPFIYQHEVFCCEKIEPLKALIFFAYLKGPILCDHMIRAATTPTTSNIAKTGGLRLFA